MINDVVEFEATPDVVKRIVKEYGIEDDPSPEALNALITFLKVPEDEREWVIQAIRAFGCPECGMSSCLHGYPDY